MQDTEVMNDLGLLLRWHVTIHPQLTLISNIIVIQYLFRLL